MHLAARERRVWSESMAISSEEDSEPAEKEPLPMPVVDSPVALGPSEGFRCRPPPLRHQVPDPGCRRPPAPTKSSSAHLHLQGPQPPSVVSSKKKAPIRGGSGTGAGPPSGRSQVAPASRNGAGATVAKIQRSAPLAGANSSRPNLFDEFQYIPLADKKAKDQAMPACSVKARSSPQVCGTMATMESIMLQKQEAGSRAAPMSCPVGEFCHGCLCVHPIVSPIQGKKVRIPQMYTPLSCNDLPIPLDRFRYTPLAEQKHQEQCGSASRSSSLSPAIGGPKVGWKRKQAASQQSKLQGFADKRRKAVPVSAAGKPKNNKKPASQQKPKRTPSVVLTPAEKRLDMYRRLPPDQLVAPSQTPYNLLQEQYAPDPWKVMVICMLLNRTRGKTIKQFVEGFFTQYPDAQTACNADLEGMAEYLRPTGLQLAKATRIKKFSSSYLSSDWTYVTDLHGVGKYAADAYAIFCAGRVRDVQPEDHKLVDYWKYVCNIGEPWEDEDSCFAI